MCGICGKVIFEGQGRIDPGLIRAMTDAISHRGPDDEGFHVAGRIGLGFSRLSIIDLEGGHQPLSNEDGSVWVVFNGEIYNFQELRKELISKGHVFRSKGDSEVLVHLYEEHGERFVDRLRGMFAIGLWDARRETLFVYRDRVGIKPLYYTQGPGSFSFASEIKSLLVDPEVGRGVDPLAVREFLAYFYIPGERTLFEGIKRLLPGHYLVVGNSRVDVRRYWDLEFPESRPGLSLQDGIRTLNELLAETVRLHMISDVPVGFFLSGGVDSTALLSLAVEQTDRPISSFTIGFEGQRFEDERPYARLAARRFGTTHHEITLTAQDFRDTLGDYVWHMEDPVCEPPAISLFHLSKIARRHVKVLISGEGGDEAFAGYPNYRNLYWMEAFGRAAGPFRGLASKVLSGLGAVPPLRRLSRFGPLLSRDLDDYYYSRTSSPFSFFNDERNRVFADAFRRRLEGRDPAAYTRDLFSRSSAGNALDRMLYVDTKSWLPDDLLIKADKITMAHSLELRVPLLDHKVLEFASSLPRRFKLNGLSTKFLLKKALSDRVPKEILDRKKAGFPVPYESWLRNDLKDYVHDVLTDSRCLGRGFLNPGTSEKLIRENSTSGRFSKEIFSLLVLELWHRTFADQTGAGTSSSRPVAQLERTGIPLANAGEAKV